MADLRRLGKRGSYRLGSLRPGRPLDANGRTSLLGRAGRRPRRLTFDPPRSHARLAWWLAAVVAGAVVIAVMAASGLWFVPFIVGLAVGLGAPRAGWRLRHTLPGVLVMAAAGWGIPLLWLALHGEPAGATARVIAALAGLAPHAVTGVLVTLLVACLQAAAGLWLGRSVTPSVRIR